MLYVFAGSTATLTANLTNLAGTAQTGATVTVTIAKADGTVIVTAASMSDAGSGNYTYTISSSLLTEVGSIYSAAITATKSGETRYAKVSITLQSDDS